jgi:ABC-2 type transport system permease protein
MNRALLVDGAREPRGFWVRYAIHQALLRLRVHAVVLLLPVALLSGLYWWSEMGEQRTWPAVFRAAAATAAAGALVHVLVGALLDLACETSRLGALLGREVRFYFHTPVPYLVMVLFTVASGMIFTTQLQLSETVSFLPAFQNVTSFLIFLIPILTIRSFAEEKASGTVEPLLTAPVSEAQVVAAKFLGAMSFYLVMLLPTLAYYAVLRFVGAGASLGKPDLGPVVSGYAGLVLFGAFHVAIGIFASTLTQDAVLGAFLAFVITIFFWIVEPVMQMRQFVDTPGWTKAAEYISPHSHLNPFLQGVLSPADAIYFVTFGLFFLFLSVRSIEYRKWR